MDEPERTSPSPHDGTGAVKISDEVIAAVAGVAATAVEGVSCMSGGLVGDISERLGKKSLAKGVKVDASSKGVTLDLHLIVSYGCRIPEVAAAVQAAVKKAVEYSTGLAVKAVNIHVQGVSFKSEREPSDESGEPEAEPGASRDCSPAGEA